MRRAGIQGISRRGRAWTTRRDRDARPAPDLVERDFGAPGPDQLWVANITYVPTWVGFLYLAVVVDAWSRRVVGWAMANHLRTELVLDALNMALGQRPASAVIHHSDQGCQLYVDRVRAAVSRGRSPAVDGIGGRLLRQRDGRELLRHDCRPHLSRSGPWGPQCAPAAFGGQRAPDRKRRALHQAEIGARAGPIWHYVAQDQPLHVVVGDSHARAALLRFVTFSASSQTTAPGSAQRLRESRQSIR